ncbi:MAG: hypothetical protein II225_03665 [Ruminococcus sp.]|nr:hypothetical protein [Ruminococcus sp.]
MPVLQEYKCPCCGGAIEFSSQLQKMKCPYCDSEFEMDALREFDEILKEEASKEDKMDWETEAGTQWSEGEEDDLRIYVCQSCGGEIIGDETLAATACPYCNNPVVMMGQFKGDLRPDYVIPFKLDKNAAKEGLKKHMKGKILLPKSFKSENRINEIKGMYVPFWLFDTDTSASIRYKATKVRFWSDSKYDYTKTSFYSVLRGGNVGFEKVPVDGSSKMADDLMESIEPYNFSDAVDFQTAYLAGYLADKYDVTANDSIQRANERIRKSTEETFRSTVMGYSTVVTEHSNVQFFNSSAKYALYPVWILNSTYKGKNYTFAMNGQTGKFVGDLPMDKGKFWRLWGLITTASSALALLIIFLVQNWGGLFG